MTTAIFKDGALHYKKNFRSRTLPVDDIVWAYLQQEEVNAKICCGRASFEIGRLIVVDKDGKKEVFQYEGLDQPKKLLDEIQSVAPSVAIGYTKENIDRFQK